MVVLATTVGLEFSMAGCFEILAGLPAAWDGKQGPRIYLSRFSTAATDAGGFTMAGAAAAGGSRRIRLRVCTDRVWASGERYEAKGAGGRGGRGRRPESHWVQQRTNESCAVSLSGLSAKHVRAL